MRLVPLAAVLFFTCATAVRAGGPTLWVDASAPLEGDGTKARPFKTLQAALVRAGAGTHVRLSAGLYQGPFTLPSGVVLEGRGPVVLFAEGLDAPVVRAEPGTRLVDVVVQGGGVGLQPEADVALERVRFSGQRRSAIIAGRGKLRGHGLELTAGVSQTRGMVVGEGSEVELTETRFRGPFLRGVELQGGVLRLHRANFEGPLTAVHQRGGTSVLQHLEISAGDGPALFVSQSKMTASHVDVRGHEYGLQAGRGAELDITDFTSTRSYQAGLAVVGARGRLQDVVVVESGNLAGMQLLNAQLFAERVRLKQSTGVGLVIRHGDVELRDVLVVDVRGDLEVDGGRSTGDGVQVRDARATLVDLEVRNVSGIALLATQAAKVKARGLQVAGARHGAVVVERLAEVEVVGAELTKVGQTAMVAHDQGKLWADHVRAPGAEVVAWAECVGETAAHLGAKLMTPQHARAPCVQRWSAPRAK